MCRDIYLTNIGKITRACFNCEPSTNYENPIKMFFFQVKKLRNQFPRPGDNLKRTDTAEKFQESDQLRLVIGRPFSFDFRLTLVFVFGFLVS